MQNLASRNPRLNAAPTIASLVSPTPSTSSTAVSSRVHHSEGYSRTPDAAPPGAMSSHVRYSHEQSSHGSTVHEHHQQQQQQQQPHQLRPLINSTHTPLGGTSYPSYASSANSQTSVPISDQGRISLNASTPVSLPSMRTIDSMAQKTLRNLNAPYEPSLPPPAGANSVPYYPAPPPTPPVLSSNYGIPPDTAAQYALPPEHEGLNRAPKKVWNDE